MCLHICVSSERLLSEISDITKHGGHRPTPFWSPEVHSVPIAQLLTYFLPSCKVILFMYTSENCCFTSSDKRSEYLSWYSWGPPRLQHHMAGAGAVLGCWRNNLFQNTMWVQIHISNEMCHFSIYLTRPCCGMRSAVICVYPIHECVQSQIQFVLSSINSFHELQLIFCIISGKCKHPVKLECLWMTFI